MTIEDVVRDRIEERGITVAETARRCKMNDQLLRRSLYGSRAIKSAELVRLCPVLGLTLEDFASCEAA